MAGAAYFAMVFAIGFALGAARTLVTAPALGEVGAVALEAPVMLVLSWLVAAWCAARLKVPATPPARLAMGGVAFALLMAAELALSLFLMHLSLAQHLASYGTLAGAVGLGAQITFAFIPLALTWRTWSGLAITRAIHTVIYAVMASATFVVLYAGVTGMAGAWLWAALGLVGVESAVFLGNGFRCPLTAVAVHFGADEGADTCLPERFTRYTFRVFGPLIVVGVALVALRLFVGHLR